MYYERLLIEPTDDGWIRFGCPDRLWAGESATGLIRLDRGFTAETILEALPATGWAIERAGEWRLLDSQNCKSLVRLLDEMSAYFEGPDEPSEELLRIKFQVDALLADDAEAGVSVEPSLWDYARLDLLLRDDLAEAARTCGDIWQQERFQLDAGRYRDLRIRELRRRIARIAERQPAPRMAASARAPGEIQIRGRNAG